MLNVNNNAAMLKREILVRITKMQLNNTLLKNVRYIPRELAPAGSKPVRCCIYHDREILKMRTAARLGFSVEELDEDTELEDLAAKGIRARKANLAYVDSLARGLQRLCKDALHGDERLSGLSCSSLRSELSEKGNRCRRRPPKPYR